MEMQISYFAYYYVSQNVYFRKNIQRNTNIVPCLLKEIVLKYISQTVGK